MGTYAEQLETVKTLPLRGGDSRRFDCPFCGGGNTLSVTRTSGELRWHCFRASCKARGRAGEARTAEDLVRVLRQREEKETPPLAEPDHWVLPTSNVKVMDWLHKYNALDAYTHRRVGIRYDPRTDRVVFLVRDPDSQFVVDACGRALTPGVKPKWLRYGKSRLPVVVGEDKSLAVVVEDATSACAVSGVATGVGLMGTNMTSDALRILKNHNRVIIALDPDARMKALTMQREVAAWVPTTVKFIADDLKYFGPERIRQELGLA
jgi:hypothetical protein